MNWGTGNTPITVAKSGVFTCPSALSGSRWTYQAHRVLLASNNWSSQKPMRVRTLAELRRPADMAVFAEVGVNPAWDSTGEVMESGWWWHGGAQSPPVFTGNNSGAKFDADDGTFPNWNMPRYRHTGTANYAFTDGHVKSIVKGRLNWCQNLGQRGLGNEDPDNEGDDDWIFNPGEQCAGFGQ